MLEILTFIMLMPWKCRGIMKQQTVKPNPKYIIEHDQSVSNFFVTILGRFLRTTKLLSKVLVDWKTFNGQSSLKLLQVSTNLLN